MSEQIEEEIEEIKDVEEIHSTTPPPEKSSAEKIVEEIIDDSLYQDKFQRALDSNDENDDETEEYKEARKEQEREYQLRELRYEQRKLECNLLKNHAIIAAVIEHFKQRGTDVGTVEEVDEDVEFEKQYEKVLKDFIAAKADLDLARYESNVEIQALKTDLALHTEESEKIFEQISTKALEPITPLAKSFPTITDKPMKRHLKRLKYTKSLMAPATIEFDRVDGILKQLKAEYAKLDDLGDGLRMADIELLRAETATLAEKIEEKNDDLVKHRFRCEATTQHLAHMREKQQIMEQVVAERKFISKYMADDLQAVRKEVVGLKSNLGSLRKEHQAVKDAAGIGLRPDLLRHYQESVGKVKKVKAEKEELEQKMEKLLK